MIEPTISLTPLQSDPTLSIQLQRGLPIQFPIRIRPRPAQDESPKEEQKEYGKKGQYHNEPALLSFALSIDLCRAEVHAAIASAEGERTL
jgi:hypothetical protein